MAKYWWHQQKQKWCQKISIKMFAIYLHQKPWNLLSVRIQSYSGPYFPAFRLNTMRYGVYRDKDTFHGVLDNK